MCVCVLLKKGTLLVVVKIMSIINRKKIFVCDIFLYIILYTFNKIQLYLIISYYIILVYIPITHKYFVMLIIFTSTFIIHFSKNKNTKASNYPDSNI